MIQESKPLRKVQPSHIYRTMHYLHAIGKGVSLDRVYRVLRAQNFKIEEPVIANMVHAFLRQNSFVSLVQTEDVEYLQTFTDEVVTNTIRYLFFMQRVLLSDAVLRVLQPQTYQKGARVNMAEAHINARLRAYALAHEDTICIRNAPDGVQDEYALKTGIVEAIQQQSKQTVKDYERRAADKAVPATRRELNPRRVFVDIGCILERIDVLPDQDVDALVAKYPEDTWVLCHLGDRRHKLLVVAGSVPVFRARREYANEFQVRYNDVRDSRLKSFKKLREKAAA